MPFKLIAAIAVVTAGALSAQTGQSSPLRVGAVRTWSPGSVTRVVIEVSGPFEYHSERLHNPSRVFFDILQARPLINGKRVFHRELKDKLVSRVRVAETLPGVTRVVLDLAANVEFSASRISNPSRLVVELRPSASPHVTPATPMATPVTAAPAQAPVLAPPTVPVSEPVAAASTRAAASPPPEVVAPTPKAPPPAPPATAASRTSAGTNSLVRALGLKIHRVVIDPGHGGHDQGTTGPRGVVEKDLVLDIAKRLGKRLEQEVGCEVVYTRTDDTFVPLEARTALANEKRADLFISLHANSSKYPRIAGVETFYLNFTNSRDAMDVAARENASSDKNISELQDLLQRIARQDKIEESKELATRIQATLFSFSAKYNPGIRNRGVKKAPFIVLVGATMPSVLVEIGFLSNSREENLLKRPEHRQRVADAVQLGISRYVRGLSHFQVAQAKDE